MPVNIVTTLLLVLVANTVFSKIVPHIQNLQVYLDPLEENSYFIRIPHSDGTALEQVLKKSPNGQYVLKGLINVPKKPQDHWNYVLNNMNQTRFNIQFLPNNQIPNTTSP